MSCDGSHARIDTSGVGHLATKNGTSQRDTYFQCWLVGSDGSNAVGLVWRFQDTSNYYFIRATTGAGVSWGVFRFEGGVATQIGGFFGSVTAGLFQRVGVRHVGTRIQIYFDNNYDTGSLRDGPVFDEVDTDAQGQLWSGPCGISSGANNATGITNLKWSDFISFDGGADTIYVDLDFNGGVPGEGMGTAARPDLTIRHGLNNVGLNRGGRLKLTDPLYTNLTGVNSNFIGHADKFLGTFTFPSYDPENGSLIGLGSAGSPNLTIEGMDGGRTVLREVNGGTGFFVVRGTATGIVYRSFDYELTVDSSAASTINQHTSGNDHSQQYAKCKFDFQVAGGNNQAVTLNQTAGVCERFEMFFCYGRCGPASDEHNFYVNFVTRVKQVRFRFNVFKGFASLTTPGELSAAINMDTGCDLQPGDVYDFDHMTFLDIFRGFFPSDSPLTVLDPHHMDGSIEFQNNITTGPGAFATDPTTDFGIYTNGMTLNGDFPPVGTFVAHHNGYADVTTPHDAAVTDGGNNHVGPPDYTAPSSAFTWLHTAGQGLGGEGTSSAIVLEGDWRPRDPDYVHTADDSTPGLGILDRGAIQGYIPASEGGGGSVPSSVPIPGPGPGPGPGGEDCRYCISVVFDPGGPQEHDLSMLFKQMTPLRYERDILLRNYRASDVTMIFKDPNELFLESNPDSFLLDSTGEPKWLGTPVLVSILFGEEVLTQYRGFVLQVVARRAIGQLRIGNRFQELFDRQVLANDIVRITDTDGIPQHPRSNPPGGGFVARPPITFNLSANPPIEILTFEIQNSSEFICVGSVSGFEGSGNIGDAFTTLSGSITIASNATWNTGTHVYAANQRFTIELGWASSVLQNPPTADPIRPILDIWRDFILSPQGGALEASELDSATINALSVMRNNQQARPFVVDKPQKGLETLDALSLHLGAVAIEKINATIGLLNIMPRIVPAGTLDTLCHGDDLMSAEIDHLQIYNQFVSSLDYDVATQEFLDGFVTPTRLADNPSFMRYGRLLPAPRKLEFKSYSVAIADNEPWVALIAEVLYRRYENPALTAKVRTKLRRMTAELDDTYTLDSIFPTTRIPAMEVFSIDKRVSDDLTVDLELIDVSSLIQEEGECGFIALDTPPIGIDQCWGVF
jgi:hypothetical protein